MSLFRLAICVSGVYACFLLWALVQEKLSSTPYPDPTSPTAAPRFFRSVLFLNTVQSAFSSLAALAYLFARRKSGTSVRALLGLENKAAVPNGAPAGREKDGGAGKKAGSGDLLRSIAKVAVFQSLANPFGFASLRHISYPTMVLAKSCKLVPVMLMNVVLYRRRFAPHKYLVVALVTLGISLFTLLAPSKKASKGSSNSSPLGLSLLLINLLLDGMTNSSQDAIFRAHRISGTQMMLWMNAFATLLTAFTIAVPLPAIPVLHPAGSGESTELLAALDFIRHHPAVLRDIGLYAACGALGQLFIFETLEHFGSLTLVTITVTRKLFTMLLSVFIFRHRLAPGQWFGAAVVFVGIGVEAWVKRQETLSKQAIREEKRAELKSL